MVEFREILLSLFDGDVRMMSILVFDLKGNDRSSVDGLEGNENLEEFHEVIVDSLDVRSVGTAETHVFVTE